MTDEREALENEIKSFANGITTTRAEVMAAAERLDEHVKTCQVFHMEPSVAEYASSQPASKTTKCGTGDPIYYCDRAPIKGRS